VHDDDQVDDTVLRPRERRAPGNAVDSGSPQPSAAPPPRLGAPLDPSDEAEGDTVVRPSRTPDRSTDSAMPVLPRSPGARGRHASPGGPPTSRIDDAGGDAGAPRPAVPSVRFGDRVFRLDRPVLVGRRPALPRVVTGPVPELVTVPSPSGLVSSSHVLVHAAGSTAVVDDLHSTNGTVVRAPGARPHRMPSGASMVVLTGTVVDIGDGNTFEVLSPFVRSVPPGGRESSGPWPSPPSSPGPSRTPRERP
jgi:hypothetical protein